MPASEGSWQAGSARNHWHSPRGRGGPLLLVREFPPRSVLQPDWPRHGCTAPNVAPVTGHCVGTDLGMGQLAGGQARAAFPGYRRAAECPNGTVRPPRNRDGARVSAWGWMPPSAEDAYRSSARRGQRSCRPVDVRRSLDGIYFQEVPDRRAVYTRVSLKDEWDRLDSKTRTWLLKNPACLILPRAMSAKIAKDARGDIQCDLHGQVVLSQADHDFIREKAEAAGTIQVPAGTEYRFFDTISLPDIGGALPGAGGAASTDEVL